MKRKKAIVLLSGGIDSTVTLFLVSRYPKAAWSGVSPSFGKQEVYALVVDYGQVHSKEIVCARYQAKVVGAKGPTFVSLSGIGKMLGGVSLLTGGSKAPAYVPFRNLVLLSVALSFAESIKAVGVFYGANVDDVRDFWDCRPEFVERVNKVAELSGSGLKVVAPYANCQKSRIIEEGLNMGVDFSKTWTCYGGLDKPCGECLACKLRAKAFEKLGLEDPLLTV